MSGAKVAVADSFLEAFARLPRAQQKKVMEFTEKFRANPLHPGINYESIHDMRDEKVRTVRIGNDYRGIVIHPPAKDVFLLVWVDHHDEAMAWARNKRFDVNPLIGSLQVYTVAETSAVPSLPAPPVAPAGPSIAPFPANDRVSEGLLLAGTSLDDLLILGVPELLLPSVTALRTRDELNVLAPFLPVEAADALEMLADGYSPEAALAEADRTRAARPKVDANNFAQALEHPASKSRFAVVETDEALLEILAAPLAKWRTFLHPSQQKLVAWSTAGPIRVLGGAGTGKTVVAIHRARHLAKNTAGKILVTTYTRNLAQQIEQSLDELCGQGAERKRIEVLNLHQWANKYLRSYEKPFSLADKDLQDELWEQTLHAETPGIELPPAFYREEWESVVQANDVTDLDAYLTVPRAGRGTRLSRRQRAEVWKVLGGYRQRLDARGRLEQADVVRRVRLLLEARADGRPYTGVVADEVQDFRTADLKLLRALVPEGPNDIMVVGDAHQRIYKYQASLGGSGINVIGRSKRLKINYRTTEKIRNWAVALLEGVSVDDLDGGIDSMKGYRSLRTGVAPTIRAFPSATAEVAGIVERLSAWLKNYPPEQICVTARTNNQISQTYKPGLSAAGIACEVISTEGEAKLGPGVRLATMHRMKGLEFPCVVIAGFSESYVPMKLGGEAHGDDASEEDHLKSERCLAHVAATRARDELLITSCGKPSAWLGEVNA